MIFSFAKVLAQLVVRRRRLRAQYISGTVLPRVRPVWGPGRSNISLGIEDGLDLGGLKG